MKRLRANLDTYKEPLEKHVYLSMLQVKFIASFCVLLYQLFVSVTSSWYDNAPIKIHFRLTDLQVAQLRMEYDFCYRSVFSSHHGIIVIQEQKLSERNLSYCTVDINTRSSG